MSTELLDTCNDSRWVSLHKYEEQSTSMCGPGRSAFDSFRASTRVYLEVMSFEMIRLVSLDGCELCSSAVLLAK